MDLENLANTRSMLNGQTAQVAWSELQRNFAAGSVIWVAKGVSLLDVGLAFVEDDNAKVEAWMSAKQLVRPDNEQARQWHADEQVFWAVVSAPWVLVQET